jgi:hypothetical protein
VAYVGLVQKRYQYYFITSGVGTAYPFGAAAVTPRFLVGSCYSIFSFICMFCRSLFVLLYVFFWPLYYLFFFDIRILITPLVSSNSSSSKRNLSFRNNIACSLTWHQTAITQTLDYWKTPKRCRKRHHWDSHVSGNDVLISI